MDYISVMQGSLFLYSVSFSPSPSVSPLCHWNLLMLDAQWIFNSFLLNVCVVFKVILAHTEEDRLSPDEHHWPISLGHLNSVICTLWLQLFNQLLI